jgi:hypothetical protein
LLKFTKYLKSKMKFATIATIAIVATVTEVDAVTLENQAHARGLKTAHPAPKHALA